LYDKYANQGLVILGFPCNQFGQQEPGNSDQIQSFCETRFGVSFPLFQKIEVNGSRAHPLYQYLKKALPGIFGTQTIKWNFTKFLVDPNGTVVKRYPRAEPNNCFYVGDRQEDADAADAALVHFFWAETWLARWNSPQYKANP